MSILQRSRIPFLAAVVAGGCGSATSAKISFGPATIALGASTTISWTATGASSCTASGGWSGAVGTSGQRSITPTSEGHFTYTLTCTGGGRSVSASATLAVTPAMHRLKLPYAAWFPEVVDFDGSGNPVLVVPTMDNDLMVTPPTPVFILGFPKDGAIADVSSDYFAEQPSFYGIRNVVHADFDGSGKQGLFFCAMGREVGDPTQYTPTNPPTPPIYGDQNHLYLWSGGKLTDMTTALGLPVEHDYCHGASAVDFDNSGKASIVVHNISAPYPPDLPREYLLKLVGGTYQVLDLEKPWQASGDPLLAGDGRFFSAAGKFTHDGYGDIVIGHTVFHGGPGPIDFTSYSTLAVEPLENEHYVYWQGALVADLNGSGLPGLLKEESNDGKTSNFLSGARYAYYLNDGMGHLVDASAKLPANLGLNDFTEQLNALDAEFKGCLDVVPHHNQYVFDDTNPNAMSHPNILLSNDCKGALTKMIFDDPVFTAYDAKAASRYPLVYFVGTANPKRYHVVYADFDGSFWERAVTPEFPLHIVAAP